MMIFSMNSNMIHDRPTSLPAPNGVILRISPVGISISCAFRFIVKQPRTATNNNDNNDNDEANGDDGCVLVGSEEENRKKLRKGVYIVKQWRAW
jgi:hypothetical protein